MRRWAASAPDDATVPIVTTPRLASTEATRRWAALLRQLFEVDPLVCSHCAGVMRIVACIMQALVIKQILTHLRTRAPADPTDARPGARSPLSTGAFVARDTRGGPGNPRRRHASRQPPPDRIRPPPAAHRAAVTAPSGLAPRSDTPCWNRPRHYESSSYRRKRLRPLRQGVDLYLVNKSRFAARRS